MVRNMIHCNILRSVEVLFLYFILLITCYPVNKPEQNTLELLSDKNENRLPNGTVVGQYTYADDDGNPIHVKYYADDGSYGVELKSIKVVESNIDQPVKQNKQYYLKTEPMKVPDILNSNYPLLSNNYKNDFDYLPKTNQEKTSDYEIYYQKELKEGAKRCSKDNIRVYYDKEKRRARNAMNVNEYGTVKYCDQI